MPHFRQRWWLASVMVLLMNLAFVGWNGLRAEEQGPCTKGCNTIYDCRAGCVCFPNPFDEFPQPGQCTN